ncbi:hypothetical protein F5B18DRAFT_656103 [Nemania serpens]|nr:hypothetical protein F5B18DRAFT_656103 [Nemania serpens]
MLASVFKAISEIMGHVADKETAAGITRFIINPSIEGIKANLKDRLADILHLHLSGHPITYNHYLTKNFQKKQDERRRLDMEHRLIRFFGSEFPCSAETHTFTFKLLINNLISSLKLDMDVYFCSKAIDIMEAYYTDRVESGGTLVPIELVDPALRNNQDLTHPIEDVHESVTNLGFDFQQPDSMDVDKHHAVDCILERWNKNLFLLRWLEDGSYWWVQRKDINADLIRSFEEKYTGINLGVDKVLATRKRRGKIEYRIRWLGRPVEEDTWVSEKQ